MFFLTFESPSVNQKRVAWGPGPPLKPSMFLLPPKRNDIPSSLRIQRKLSEKVPSTSDLKKNKKRRCPVFYDESRISLVSIKNIFLS